MVTLHSVLKKIAKSFSGSDYEKELVSKPYQKINPEKYKSFYKLDKQQIELSKPNFAIHKVNRIKINDTWFGILQITGFPSEVRDGFISEIIRSDIFFDTTIYIERWNRGKKVKQLTDSYTNLKISQASEAKACRINPRLDFKE